MYTRKFTTVCYFILLFMSVSSHAAQRHTETLVSFSYEVPDGWTVKQFENLKFKTVFAKPVGNFSPNITMVDEKFVGDLQSYKIASIPYMKKVISGFKILKESKGETRKGVSYMIMYYRHNSKVGELTQVAYFMEVLPGHKLVLTCTAPPGYEKTYEPVCTKVVNSIEIQ